MNKKKYKINKYYLGLIILILIVVVANQLSSMNEGYHLPESLDELSNAKIGVQSGTSYEVLAKDKIRQDQVVYFAAPADLIIALEQGKIDAFITEEISYGPYVYTHPWLEVVPGDIATVDYTFAIGKNAKHERLLKEMNEFVHTCEENGFLKNGYDYWVLNYNPNNRKRFEYDYSQATEILSIAVETGYEPFSFIGDGQLQGYDVEFAEAFCHEYGYKPVFYEMSFESISSGIESGKFDLGANIIVTEERLETIVPVDSYLHSSLLMIAGSPNDVSDTYIERIIKSATKTFVDENRWQLFVLGALRTLGITLIAVACGTLLGFLLFLLNRDAKDDFRKFLVGLSKIIHGTPTVLFLMILYYVIFGHSSMSGFWVSSIGFAILFTFAVFELLVSGNNAVGSGQTEAARALGYSKNRAFFRIVLPQAAMHFLPLYKSELISIIKETSVVGYIAVQDLTKVSDIIRSRTFEAMFPLISTALVYFLIIFILTGIVSQIEFKVDPKKRRERLLNK